MGSSSYHLGFELGSKRPEKPPVRTGAHSYLKRRLVKKVVTYSAISLGGVAVVLGLVIAWVAPNASLAGRLALTLLVILLLAAFLGIVGDSMDDD